MKLYRVVIHYEGCWAEDVEAASEEEAEEEAMVRFADVSAEELIDLWDEYLGACECPNCGRWYNIMGQELNPPSTWRDGDDW